MLKNYNVNPYFDDYDENNNFHRILFKPSNAVQARELTQTQTILQNQIKRFGNHVFKNGSIVTGGRSFYQDAISLKVEDEYSNTSVVVANFNNKTILSIDETKRGEVIKVFETDEGTGDPKTFIIKQIYGEPFVSGETIKTTDEEPYFATISANGINDAKVFSVSEGVFYYEGYFVRTLPQTITLSKYTSANVSARIGFEVQESIVQSTTDTSLLDPALGSSNYQAPGADRLKIDLILSSRTLDSEDDELFIELGRVDESLLISQTVDTDYALLLDAMARRTYDESGNYTIDPFVLTVNTNESNTAQTIFTLSPGKAYVEGYELKKNAPTSIIVDKPRDTLTANDHLVSSEYGNFVHTTNHYGTFPINDLTVVELHCVPRANLSFSSLGAGSNTKIGTTRIKTFEFDSFSDYTNTSTYTYRTFLFDTNVNNRIVGNVIAETSNTEIVIGSGGSLYSSSNVAYVGAKIRIKAGPGSGEPTKTILSYDGSSKTITIDQPFITTLTTDSQYNIEFSFKDTKSIVLRDGSGNLLDAADIDDRSKDTSKVFNDTFISETSTESLLFPIGLPFVVPGTIDIESFKYKRLYLNKQFTGNVTTLDVDTSTSESITDPGSNLSRIAQYFYITVKTQGSSPYTVGSIIPVDKISVSGESITVANSFSNMVADITTIINVGNPAIKSKQLVEANSQTIATVSGQDVYANGAVLVYRTAGQTHINQSFIVKEPNINQSLFVSDVYRLVAVKDFNGSAITSANLSNAIDVTSKYAFNNGQKDSYYDHASIRLNPGSKPPVGPLVVYYDKFISAGAGFFTVDSYSSINYDDIPSYTNKAGATYNLRDCLDFRPVRFDANTNSQGAVSFDVSAAVGPKIVDMIDSVELSYTHYLPRNDRVILQKDGNFEVIKGVSKLKPSTPTQPDRSMSLYTIQNGPYVADAKNEIRLIPVNNKRYTMRDIGNIDTRIQNLEYYTSLSLLEQKALNTKDLSVLDADNLPRFKNGLLVDSFTDFSVAEGQSSDFKASIDVRQRELRPSFNIYSYSLKFDSANSTGFLQRGELILPEASSVVLIDQSKASRSLNINPFNVTNFLGKIKLSPSSDFWFDEGARSNNFIDLTGGSAWQDFAANLNPILASNVTWGDWRDFLGGARPAGERAVGGDTQVGNAIVRTFQPQINVTVEGTFSQLIPQTLTRSLGERIVDLSVIHYMRETNILFVGTDFKPNTTLYPFFDNVSVNKNVAIPNKFYLSQNNIEFDVDLENPEIVTIKDGSTTVGTGFVTHVSNNIVYVSNVTATQPFTNNAISFTLVGQRTNKTYNVTAYEHNSGNATSAGASTITLRQDAANSSTSTSYVNKQIVISSGVGVGQERTITLYNPTTRVATVSPPWTTIPNSSSIYSIGNIKSDASGSAVGIFSVPKETFTIGQKLLRLVDNSSGDVGSSSTNGDANFFAQGFIKEIEQDIVSVTVPGTQRDTTTRNEIQDFGTTRQVVVGWIDPLAETFLVSPVQYGKGVFISKIRVCFKTKDDVLPVTLQLRPVVNGFPSSSTIYPSGTVSLTPDKINITDEPSLDDPTKYTEFIFDSPIYLQPGEHSFVLLANSNKYEVYTAEIGKTDLVSNRLISEQPYGGSLFLSQNGSTWTPDQNSDMMFRIFRYTFAATPATAQFLVDFPETSNVPFDLTYLSSTDVVLEDTNLNYQFNSETITGDYAGYKPITPLSDYDLNDGAGTRILTPQRGNTSFILNASMRTNDSTVAPFLNISRLGFLAVHNQINDLGLSNSDITLISGGSGYANSADVTVTISGGGGTNATAKANVVGGIIDEVYIEDSGSGYTTTPTITFTPGSGGGSGASAVIVGETSKNGGPAKAKYVSKKVTLLDGFEAGDIRVYLTAYKPIGTNILVYVKYLSPNDPDNFEDKEWQLLTLLGNANFNSVEDGDFREIVFAPGENGIPSNIINYTSSDGSPHNSFKTFSVKIILTGTNSTVVPKVKNLRAIAYPAA